MKRVFSERDVRALIAAGGNPSEVPAGAVVTPSARDAIRAWQKENGGAAVPRRKAPAVAPAANSGPTGGAADSAAVSVAAADRVFRWRPGQDPADGDAIGSFYGEPAIVCLRRRMAACAFNLWQRGWFDGGLNRVIVRVGDTLALSLREMASASMINADEIGLVRLSGRPVEGVEEPSHCLAPLLGVFRHQRQARVVLFATPPYATAMAMAKVRPPACALAQAEVVVGQIGLANGLLPDAADGAAVLGELSRQHMAILIPYQGVLVWGGHLEEALIRLEQAENLCRSLALAAPLGGQVEPMPGSTMKALLEKRQQLGFTDPRMDLKECELCDSGDFQPGVVCTSPAPDIEHAESLVQQLTDAVMQQFK